MEFKICDIGSGIGSVDTSNYLLPELFAFKENQNLFGPYESNVYSLGLCILYLASFEKISLN